MNKGNLDSPISHNTSGFRILRAVTDGDGERFIQYGRDDRNVWFSLADLHRAPHEVFQTLSRANIHILTGKSREEFKRALEAHDEFEDVPVARYPGWIVDNLYVCGDGSTIAGRRRDLTAPVVALLPDARFSAASTLEDWKSKNSPFLRGQPLVQFVYCYALTGFLLKFAPPDFQNPIIEIVGETGKGKTSLAVAAGSICGGNPRNQNGYCLSWDRTNATPDKLLRHHRDGLLILNESNLTGAEASAQADFMRVAVMKFTEPGERETMNTVGPPVFSRMALLSTSNRAIAELASGKGKSDAAVRSRVITLEANREFGIFDSIPAGYADAGEAARSMVLEASIAYGTCARAFVNFLRRYKSSAIRRVIEDQYQLLKNAEITAMLADERQLKMIALCRAAARLARQADVLPCLEDFDAAIRSILLSDSRRQPQPTGRAIIVDYLRREHDRIIDVRTLKAPLEKEAFNVAAGFWIESATRCVIPTRALRDLPDRTQILKSLRLSGVLDAEKDKLDKKVPAAVCLPSNNRRGHFVRIARSDI